MPLIEGDDEKTIAANIAELIKAGHAPDQASAIAHTQASKYRHEHRHDVDVVRNPAHTISTVLVHRAAGTNRRRRRVLRARYPKAVEVAYAKELVGIVSAAREHVKPLLAELPGLLASASTQRQDSSVFLSSQLESLDDKRTDVELSMFQGMPIVIENRAGTTRRWTDRSGESGETLMRFDYGYISGATGADGDAVDVYIGPDENAGWVYVIHQQSKASGFKEYDEDKVMLGFASVRDAVNAYCSQYNDPRFFGGVTPIQVGDFKMQMVTHGGGKIFRADAGESKRARDLLDRARQKLVDAVHPSQLDTLARKFGRRTTDVQRAQLAAQTKAALGVDIVTLDKHVPELLDRFAHENVALIKSLANNTMDEVEKRVTRAFTSGTRHEELADDLVERFGIAERHARLIARDQVGKLNGQVAAARHQELGLTRFNWVTADDDRVREEHDLLSTGGPYEYDDPPDEGLPGEPILCRCSAGPVFDDLLDDIDEAEGE